jgi:quercetin dioxygenase-like cupin family protein
MMNTIRLRKRYGLVSALAGAVACYLLGVLGFSEIALATPPSGFTSTVVGLATFEDIDVVNAGEAKVKITTKGKVDVYTLRNTFAPGGYIGWHSHPGPSLVSVQAGTATLYSAHDPSCSPQTFSVGTGFIDEGDDVHNVRNEGGVDLVLVVISIVPEGAARRIDEPSPGNCPF